MERESIIEVARRAAGLTQTELARRAKTTQSAISEYETHKKVPMLNAAERILQAAGYDLGIVTTVVWEVEFLPGPEPFWYPSRLWRVEVPHCFDTVWMPDLVHHTPQDRWDLRKPADRAGLYSMLMIIGTQHQLMRWVDGALLCEVWSELKIPARIRERWAPAVEAASISRTVSALDPPRGR